MNHSVSDEMPIRNALGENISCKKAEIRINR